MIKIQIKSILGSLIFEHEKENNTIKDTLLEAIKNGAYLSGADLSEANLANSLLPIYCKWSFGFKNDFIKIGCK